MTGTYNNPNARSSLSVSYTANSYVTEESLGRCYFVRTGDNLLWCYINLNVSVSPGTTFRTIGSVTLPTGVNIFNGASVVIPSQNNNSNLLFALDPDGTISIYSAASATGFYRTVFPMILR